MNSSHSGWSSHWERPRPVSLFDPTSQVWEPDRRRKVWHLPPAWEIRRETAAQLRWWQTGGSLCTAMAQSPQQHRTQGFQGPDKGCACKCAAWSHAQSGLGGQPRGARRPQQRKSAHKLLGPRAGGKCTSVAWKVQKCWERKRGQGGEGVLGRSMKCGEQGGGMEGGHPEEAELYFPKS